MKRGNIYWAHLDPSVGTEIKKRRPILIVSHDANNSASETITICPITSQIKEIYPFQVFIKKEVSHLPKDVKVLVEQIRTISKSRLNSQKVGTLNKNTMQKVDTALKIHLFLS